MKHCISFFAFAILPVFACAQVQVGLVREFNSGRKPVAGVKISFEGAVPTFSDADGNFRLVFQDKKPGDNIFLNEISKAGYELVNVKELEVLKLSSNGRLDIEIILAKKGVIDAAKMEYYGMSNKALLESFRKVKTSLQNRLINAELSQKEFEQRLTILQEQFDRQQKNLEEYADKFVRMNRDDMNTLQQEALELFKAGDISAAIIKLESADIISRLEHNLKEKRKIISSILFQAELYELNLKTKEAETLYDDLLKRDSTDMIILKSAENFYRVHSKYIKALRLYPKIVNHINAEPLQKINAYGSATLYALFLNRFSDAEKYTLTCLATDSTQTWIYTNLAIAYLFRGKWGDAKAIYIRLKSQFNGTESFKAALLKDLNYLESHGITHPDMPKFRAFLEGK